MHEYDFKKTFSFLFYVTAILPFSLEIMKITCSLLLRRIYLHNK